MSILRPSFVSSYPIAFVVVTIGRTGSPFFSNGTGLGGGRRIHLLRPAGYLLPEKYHAQAGTFSTHHSTANAAATVYFKSGGRRRGFSSGQQKEHWLKR